MTRNTLFTLTIFLSLIACNRGQQRPETSETGNDSRVNSNSETGIEENLFRICYSDFPGGLSIETPDASREKGFVGDLDGQKIFYELWNIPNGNSLSVKYLFLRTDTSQLGNFDFCFPETGDEIPPDSSICKRFENNIWTVDASLTIDKIPSFIQPLIVALNGGQNLSGLNGTDKDSPVIFIQDNKLVLQFWDYDNMENGWFISQNYQYDGKKFLLAKTDTMRKAN